MSSLRTPGGDPDAEPDPAWPAERDVRGEPADRGEPGARMDATAGVTALYEGHGVGLIRLAVVILGDRIAAEDVVQDAFLGLYRHWDRLADQAKALTYARSAVLNRCRNTLRQRQRDIRRDTTLVTVESAETTVLVGEEHQRVLAAIRALPDRQREALVLRFYLDLSLGETAQSMGISQGTVKSATSRAVAALARMLGEES
jgi:RNA polymerase sigma-70 factor (sigma-E family)